MIDQLLIDKIGKYLKPTKIWIIQISSTPTFEPQQFYFTNRKSAIQYLIDRLHQIPNLIVKKSDAEIYQTLMKVKRIVIGLNSNDKNFAWDWGPMARLRGPCPKYSNKSIMVKLVEEDCNLHI